MMKANLVFNPPYFPSTMEKNKITDMLISGALLGGAAYYIFYTERGQRWRDHLGELAADTMDEWLSSLEGKLEEAERMVLDGEKK